MTEEIDRILAEQRRDAAYLAEFPDGPEVRGARLGASDWVMEEVLRMEPLKRDTAVGKIWNNGMHSSLKTREDWATPRSLFEMLDREFSFKLDACADVSNAKCALYYDIEADGLSREWSPGPVWCNPPYGRKIKAWIQKAWQEAERGSTVVLLVPARTDTSWWHDYCMRGEIIFLRGRLCFDEKRKGRCPFPSAIIIFRGRNRN